MAATRDASVSEMAEGPAHLSHAVTVHRVELNTAPTNVIARTGTQAMDSRVMVSENFPGGRGGGSLGFGLDRGDCMKPIISAEIGT